MLFSKHEELEDRIVAFALRERLSIKALQKEVSRGKPLSLRAVYKAVNKLIQAGVLLKAGKRIVVDEEWARRVGEHLRPIPFPAPAPRERAVYTFNSIEHLDAFWKTAVLPLEESFAEREVFFYNPHNFWAYLSGRKGSEDAYYKHFAAQRVHGFFTVGGETTADKAFKRDYQNEHLQVDAKPISSLRRTDHLTLIGPIVISVRIPKKMAHNIDILFESGKEMHEILPAIEEECRAPGSIRFVLEHNAPKAKKLRRIFAKNFYFKLSP